jgi:DNA polymerase-3 subunit delta
LRRAAERKKPSRNSNRRFFFKVEDSFKAQVQSWTIVSLDRILSRLLELEAQCKQTAMPVDTLCAQAILGISRMR